MEGYTYSEIITKTMNGEWIKINEITWNPSKIVFSLFNNNFNIKQVKNINSLFTLLQRRPIKNNIRFSNLIKEKGMNNL